MDDVIPFWEKPLDSLNAEQWEQLCDGCGRCCLKKLVAEDSDEIFYTRIVCRYFDQQSSRCQCYSARNQKVPDCLVVKNSNINELNWMPETCAYKLRHQGKPLYDWHPLIAGNRIAMERAGISIRGKVLSEEYVHQHGMEEHIINWVKASDE